VAVAHHDRLYAHAGHLGKYLGQLLIHSRSLQGGHKSEIIWIRQADKSVS